jgi:NADP-dependent aldehyde dehydrogenase
MEPEYVGGTVADVNTACTVAEAAFDACRSRSLEQRALLLEAIADGIVALGDVLIERVIAESGTRMLTPAPRVLPIGSSGPIPL